MKEIRINLSEMAQKIHDDVKNLVKGFSDMDLAAYAMGQWVPRADLFKGKTEIRLFLDLPGIESGSVDVSLTGNELKVSGNKDLPVDVEGFQSRLAERRCGAFSRTFPLPAAVDPESVSASLRNGRLDIVLAKKADSVEREIKVDVK
ncbi:MAG: Hsp20/alpha crystallin family protein [Planctomycetota bacterium]|jgi:HSP20 family protein